jgi:DNA-binding IclR family transcriptional regulator
LPSRALDDPSIGQLLEFFARISVRVNEEFPLDRGASGRILVAFTENQDPRWNDIREQLWAVSHGERDPEAAAVSVPVFGVTGELVGALTVSGPRSRLDNGSTIAAAIAALLTAAKRATTALGGASARFDASIAKTRHDEITAS